MAKTNGASRRKRKKKTSLKTGFALLSPEERAQLGRRGGRRAHENGTAHQFEAGKEARKAGRKGGKAKYARKRKVADGELS